MKKTFAFIIALTMLVSLSACGRQNLEGSLSTPAPAAETSAPAETTAAPTEAPAAATEAPAAATEAPVADGEGTITASTTNGNRYENPTLGFGVELDADWHVYSTEELAQLSGLTAEVFSSEKYQEAVSNAQIFYDFCAAHASGASINIIYENLGLLYGLALDEEQYRAMSMQNMEAAYTDAGFTDISIEENTVTFAGAERVGILTKCKIQGSDYYIQQVLFKAGSHVAVVTLSSFQDELSDMTELFFALD